MLKTIRNALLGVALTASCIAGAGAGTLFTDDFSGTLSAWNTPSGGTWNVANGALNANYGIGCGSVGCPQADLILADSRQPSGDYSASVDFSRTGDPSYPGYYAASAQFALWRASNNRLSVSIGSGGFSNWGGPQTTIDFSVMKWTGSWSVVGVGKQFAYTWNANEKQTAKIVKVGSIYSVYINGTYLTEFTDSVLQGTGKIGLHTYGPKTYDNFKLEDNIPVPPTIVEYDLGARILGAGNGTVTSTPGGMACSSGNIGTCGATLESGTSVTLRATPATGSTFSGWGDACSAAKSATTCTLTMSAAQSATAEFVITTPVCEIIPSANNVPAGTQVVLTSKCTPTATGYVWGGGQCDGLRTPSCTVTPDKTTFYAMTPLIQLNQGEKIHQGATVNATVVVTTPPPLGTPSAPVVSNLAGGQSATGLNISFNVTDAESSTLKVLRVHYGPSQTVSVCYQDLSLTTGAKTTTFNGRGTAENGGSCASLIPTSGTAKVWFKVEAVDPGGLTAAVQSGSVDYVALAVPTCQLTASPSTVVAGSKTTLTANCTGATSYNWSSGLCARASNTCVLSPTPPGAYSVQGVNNAGVGEKVSFTVTVNPDLANAHDLTVTVMGSGVGTVISYPDSIICTFGTCEAAFPKSTAVRLTAIPSVGSSFSGFAGACSAIIENACFVSLSAAKFVTAAFEFIPPKPGECEASAVVAIEANGYAYSKSLYQAFDVQCQNGRYGGIRLPNANETSDMGVYAFRQTSCPIDAIKPGAATAADLTLISSIHSEPTTDLLKNPVLREMANWVCQ